METLLTLLVSLLAAVAVLLMVWGIFGGRRDTPVQRLERYARRHAMDVAASASAAAGGRGRGGLLGSSRAFLGLDRAVERRDWGANLARELARADLALRPTEFLLIRVGLLVGLPVVGFLLGATVLPGLANPLAWLVLAVLGWWLPGFWLRRRQTARLRAFDAKLADTITLIANALRAGSSFLQAVELVVRETAPPVSTEFQRVIREVNLGLPFETALANLGRRVRSEDLDLMITAINIQYQVGGNLAEILDSIAFTIRERVRIKGEIRTLTAQQRMSGYVVAGLPIFLMVIINVIAPSFFAPMFEAPPAVVGIPLGLVLLAIGALMMLVGFSIIRRIVDIRV
jgi:tight adherence protein B